MTGSDRGLPLKRGELTGQALGVYIPTRRKARHYADSFSHALFLAKRLRHYGEAFAWDMAGEVAALVPRGETESELEKWAQDLAGRFPAIECVWLFGSRAEGRGTPASDTDILVDSAVGDPPLGAELWGDHDLYFEGLDLFAPDGNGLWVNQRTFSVLRDGELRRRLPPELPRLLYHRAGSGDAGELRGDLLATPPPSHTGTWYFARELAVAVSDSAGIPLARPLRWAVTGQEASKQILHQGGQGASLGQTRRVPGGVDGAPRGAGG